LLVFILGIVSFYYTILRPQLSVELASNVVGPNEPYVAHLIINNKGYFSLFAVKVRCYPSLDALAVEQNVDVKASIRIPEIDVDQLHPGDPRSFICDALRTATANVPIGNFRIEVCGEFRLVEQIPWPTDRWFVFQQASEAGGMRWTRLPLYEKTIHPSCENWSLMQIVKPD
jgi:hypothetical protein